MIKKVRDGGALPTAEGFSFTAEKDPVIASDTAIFGRGSAKDPVTMAPGQTGTRLEPTASTSSDSHRFSLLAAS